MSLKPIKVWGQGGPNPPKVAAILEELSLPHEFVPIEFSQVKSPEYLAVNPNGRLPAIQDPNTDLTLWESGAILEYIVEKYDTEHKFSFPAGSTEAYLAKQWLFFQVSGQGPYYGQAVWFKKYAPEPIPYAIDRYVKEIKRVTGVLEGHLEKEKKKGGEGPWLVGGKFSYADLAFVPWQMGTLKGMIPKEQFDPDEFPLVKDWIERMAARPAIKKALEVQH